MSSDMKRMELLSMNFSDLVERCLVAETMWQENIDKNDALRAENERLKLQNDDLLRRIIELSKKLGDVKND